MKKLLLLIFAIALSTQIAFSFSGSGSGTLGDPYQITNVTQLQEMRYEPASHYILMNDIDASATTGWNVGTGYWGPFNFIGSLNGRNFTISNLFSAQGNYVGLFRKANYAEIYDVILTNVDFSGGSYVGGICGDASSNVKIINCHVSGSIDATADYIGGIVGRLIFSNTVKDCSSSATVSGDDYVGGFVGWTTDSDISECFVTGNVSSGDNYIGGFIGRNNQNSTITNCYSTGEVNGDYQVGGFFGVNQQSSSITKCYSTGDVDGNSQVGGFGGRNYATVSGCYWDTQTSGRATSSGGSSRTTAQMKQQATFSGWDFANIWGIVETESYPFFGESIPTLTEWAAIFMGILLAGFGVFFIFRKMG